MRDALACAVLRALLMPETRQGEATPCRSRIWERAGDAAAPHGHGVLGASTDWTVPRRRCLPASRAFRGADRIKIAATLAMRSRSGLNARQGAKLRPAG